MVKAICKEIEMQPPLSPPTGEEKEKIETIYFGGGTPSILSKDELTQLFAALKNKFVFADDVEVTLEANPDDITKDKLFFWKEIGINRFSFGIQSFDDVELQWMNRAHTAEESLKCIDDVRAVGFTNFSVDLIYGSPLLSNAAWKKNVEILLQKDIPHISCYALTIEPKTALAKTVKTFPQQNIDTDKQANQFLNLMEWLSSAGYEHYEISNFAKPNYRSKHNNSYWQGKAYYGFGPSAHSFDGANTRKWNINNNALYIKSIEQNTIPFEQEILTPTQQLNEYIMTSLRTIEGLNLNYVSGKFGENFSEKLKMKSEKYFSTKKMNGTDEVLKLTNEGKLFADGTAADLFF